MKACAICNGAHGPAWPLTVAATHGGARFPAGTPLCLHCTGLVTDASPSTDDTTTRTAKAAAPRRR